VAQPRDGPRCEREPSAGRGVHLQPPGRQHAQDVSMGEREYVAVSLFSRASARSARAPICRGPSPPGKPSRHMFQPSGVVTRSYSPKSHSRRSSQRTACSPYPGSRHVSCARSSGLQSTSEKLWSASSALSARARRRPASISGRSVRPVCRPNSLHSVWPWRTRTTLSPCRVIRIVVFLPRPGTT
jgi:hypothetical protein